MRSDHADHYYGLRPWHRPPSGHQEAIELTKEEIQEIVEEVDRLGGHCWGFRLEAKIKAAKEWKRRSKL